MENKRLFSRSIKPWDEIREIKKRENKTPSEINQWYNMYKEGSDLSKKNRRGVSYNREADARLMLSPKYQKEFVNPAEKLGELFRKGKDAIDEFEENQTRADRLKFLKETRKDMKSWWGDKSCPERTRHAKYALNRADICFPIKRKKKNFSYIDELIEKAFSDGYEYAQREFNSKAQKARREKFDIQNTPWGDVDVYSKNLETLNGMGFKNAAKTIGRYTNSLMEGKINYKWSPTDNVVNVNKEINSIGGNDKLNDHLYKRNKRILSDLLSYSKNKKISEKASSIRRNYRQDDIDSIRREHPIGSAIHDVKKWIKKK